MQDVLNTNSFDKLTLRTCALCLQYYDEELTIAARRYNCLQHSSIDCGLGLLRLLTRVDCGNSTEGKGSQNSGTSKDSIYVKRSLEYLSRALGLDPRDPQSHFQLARLLARLQRYDEAEDHYLQVRKQRDTL